VGERPLIGEVLVSGSKNATLPILAATLLVSGEVVLDNVPNILDVRIMGELIESLGVTIRKENGGHTWHLYIPPKLKTTSLSEKPRIIEKTSSIRGSLFLLSALLSRCGKVRLPSPGGCKIGRRPIDLHLMGLRRLGFSVDEEVLLDENGEILAVDIVGEKHQVRRGSQSINWIYLDFPSVGATENILIAAASLPGITTVIENAAAEPQVVALAGFLRSLGIRIYGIGTRHLIVTGRPIPIVVRRPLRWRIFGDTLEAGTFAIYAAAIPDSRVTVMGAPVRFLRPLIARLEETGARVDIISPDILRVEATSVPSPIRKLSTLPYPGFPTDLQPILAVYLTRAAGSSKIYEFVYEKRFLYVQELCKMIVQGNSDASGAFIEKLLVELEGKHCNFCAGETGCEGRGEENIRAIRINGPFRLHGAEVEAKNLRAGAALILAGLMAEGQTVVWGARHVRRGYENLPHKLRTLGAEISEIGENE